MFLECILIVQLMKETFFLQTCHVCEDAFVMDLKFSFNKICIFLSFPYLYLQNEL